MRWWQNLQTADVLVPTPQSRSPLSQDDEVRTLLGAGALEWAHAFAVDLTREYVEGSIPELARSVDFTRRLEISAEANVLGLLLSLGSDSEPLPPQEALDFAHEAVAREVPLVAVLRGYRLGVHHWLRWCAPAIARNTDPAHHAEELQLAVTVGVRYIDRLSETMIVEYERELQRRATSGATRRAAMVRVVLAGEEVDVEDTSRLLHYPLRGRHVAMALEVRADTKNRVEALETQARAVAAGVGASAVLTVATGLTTMDAWITVRPDAVWPEIPVRAHVSVGMGSAHDGVAGFIQSRQEAHRALEISHMAVPGRLPSIARYDRVRLLALVSTDIRDLRAFVTASLGGLAHADARSRELRETLLAFLAANNSYAAVARSSHLHKNTVVQRVTKASELLGRDMPGALDVHVALMLADVFGDQVLADAVGEHLASDTADVERR